MNVCEARARDLSTGQYVMKFTEPDLHNMSDEGRWSAECASLTDSQFDELLAIVKHPIPVDTRVEFKIWLNRLFASYVDCIRQQERIERRGTAPRSRPGSDDSYTKERRSKLSTRVRDELADIRRAIQGVTRLIERQSPPSRSAVQTYICRKHLVGRTRVRLGHTFRETWVAACDAFLVFQFACERYDEVDVELSCTAREELASANEALDDLMAVIEGMSTPARRVLEWSCEDLEPCKAEEIEDPLQNILEWMSLLEAVSARPRIEVKTGRDEVALKTLVAGLAELYRAITGKEPGRVYRAVKTRRGEPRGETGDFLKLVRMLVKYAHEAAPGIGKGGRKSLSKVVREVLEERRAAHSA